MTGHTTGCAQDQWDAARKNDQKLSREERGEPLAWAKDVEDELMKRVNP